ncbi:hypothetical protein AB0H37_24770 [Actinomadura sp. NPDC023710]|uniref:hypothetical protein n=1 Tax=Actinomadura sp. NPDC023710 TaxID=3158219 RepID=UPI0033E6EDDC
MGCRSCDGRWWRAGRVPLGSEEATEHTEVRYATGKVTQSVAGASTLPSAVPLVGERVLDPSARPVNDPARPTR